MLLIEPAPNRWNARATTIPIATSGRRMWPAPISKRSMRSRRCVALAIVRPKQLPGAPTAVAPCCVDGLGRLRDRSRAFESKSPPLGWGRQTGEGLAEQNRSVPRHGRLRGTSHELPLLLVPVQGGKGVHPRHRRAEPVLPAWDEVTALAQDSHPYHVGRLLPLPRRGRIDRRAAARTERLQAWIAALGGGLEVCRRLTRYAKGRTGNRNIDAEGRAGAGLAISAVANRGLLRVRFAFDPDVSAVARAVDFHGFVPFPKSGSCRADGDAGGGPRDSPQTIGKAARRA